MNIDSNQSSSRPYSPDRNSFKFKYDNTQRRVQSPPYSQTIQQPSQYESKDVESLKQQINFLTSLTAELELKNRAESDKLSRIGEYEKKIVVCTEEIERLNSVVFNISSKLKQESEKRRQAEAQSYQIRQKGSYEAELRKKLSEYEHRLGIRPQKLDKPHSLRNIPSPKANDYEVETLRKKVKDLSDGNKKLYEYQRRISILSDQVQRLNSLLAQDNPHQLTQKNTEAKGKQYMEQTFARVDHRVCQERVQILEKEVQRLNVVIGWLRQQNIKTQQEFLKQGKQKRPVSKDKQHIFRIESLSQQIERLQRVLAKKQQLPNRGDDKKSYSVKQMSKLSSEILQLKNKISKLTQQNSNIKENLGKYKILAEKAAQYERRLKIFSKQIQRLNLIVQSKQSELDLKQKVISDIKTSKNSEMQIDLQKADITRQSSQLKEKLRISEENRKQLADIITQNAVICEQLKQKLARLQNQKQFQRPSQINSVNKQYQRRISILSHQVQRLHIQLQTKNKDTQSLKSALSQIQTSRTVELQKKDVLQSEETNNILTQSQSRVMALTLQLERLNTKLKDTQQLRRNAEERLKQQTKQTDSLRTRLSHYEQQVVKINQSFERLNNLIAELRQQNIQLKMQLKELQLTQPKYLDTPHSQTLQYSPSFHLQQSPPPISPYTFPQQ